MATLKEIYQQYLDMSNSSRVGIAHKCANAVITYCNNCGISSDDTAYFIINLFKLCVSADKSTGNPEYEFFKEITGLTVSYDSYFDAVNYGSNSDFVAQMDRIIDAMPQDIKNETLVFCLCIMACDGKLTVTEQQLLDRLMR
jgi:hypothetical protein